MLHAHGRHGHQRCDFRNREVTYIPLVGNLGHGKEQVVISYMQFAVGSIDADGILAVYGVAQRCYLPDIAIVQERIG